MAHGGHRFTANLWQGIRQNLNFFRVHLLFFTFIPLFASAVLYASNGKYPISYIDALFNSQVVLFLQMCVGSPVGIHILIRVKEPNHPVSPGSCVMAHGLYPKACVPAGLKQVKVTSLRYSFAKTLDHLVTVEAARSAGQRLEAQLTREISASRGRDRGWSRRVSTLFRRRSGLSPPPESRFSTTEDALVSKEQEGDKTVRPRMIRSMETPPRLVDPSGPITETGNTPDKQLPECPSRNHMVSPSAASSPERASIAGERASAPKSKVVESVASHPFIKSNIFHTSPKAIEWSRRMSKATNVGFSPTVGHRDSAHSTRPDTTRRDGTRQRRPTVVSTGAHDPLARNPTIHIYRSVHTVPHSDGYLELLRSRSVYSGFGGFPMPHQILGRFLGWLFPKAKDCLHKTMTIPITTSLTGASILSHGGRGSLAAPDRGIGAADVPKPVTYISFRATVGRNSAFRSLTSEQLEELGRVEYLASNVLLWLVAMYHVGVQIISFVVIAPYMSMSKWSSDFKPPALQRPLAPACFRKSDVSWQSRRLTAERSVYPPSSLSFFALPCWMCFLILDIGNSTVGSIPAGTRIVAGLFQAIAVRNAGFSIVPLSQLAPAVKPLDPISLSVLSTNVYEKQSLGNFPSNDDDEENSRPIGSRVPIWSRYLGLHARRQLSSVGLSLGVPNQNHSFSGSLRPLSKLVVALVMLLGRHSGLPVAIDRAVMLPSEFKIFEETSDPQPTMDEKRSCCYCSNQASTLFNRPGEVADIPKNEEGVSANRSESDELRLGASRRNSIESSSRVLQ
ncbi:hypothetical protein EDD16DRAFT_1523878 [Pisolithus croceorrhizus]|nr:hypothetical protein EDD16DRAFT_1523878 [Pisolithus croceorrhizus]